MATLVSTGSNRVTFFTMETRGIGQFVRERRARLGWTQDRLSEETGISRARIAQIEGGRVALPGANVRRDLAKALGVSHLDMLIAAGEITEDEIRTAGVEGIAEPDPVLAELIADLRRLPLTGERPTTFRRLLDVFAENDRRAQEAAEAINKQRNAGDDVGINRL